MQFFSFHSSALSFFQKFFFALILIIFRRIQFPEHPAALHINLWKNRPASVSDPADINYEMILK